MVTNRENKQMEELRNLLTRNNKIKILVIGDVMLDEYIWGRVDRISPEAPVQIIQVNSRNYVLGGAANVAHNLLDMGVDVELCSVVGDDENGNVLRKLISTAGIGDKWIVAEKGRKTTLKTRVIAHDQQVVRIDHETTFPVKKEINENIFALIDEKLKNFDGVILSDYAKGFLTGDFAAKIIRACKREKKEVIVDPKGSDYRKYTGATVITPNLKELEHSSGIKLNFANTICSDDEISRACTKVMDDTSCEVVVVTRGKDGMSVCIKGNDVVNLRAEAKEVYDVSGAGDTAIAALGFAYFSGIDVISSARLANIAAGIVVGKVGTATALKEEILKRVDNLNIGQRLLSEKELSLTVSRLRANNKHIVFTNGCFDILHIGHIFLLQKAKSFGDVLIVGLNSDESVRRLKGEKRPLISEKERALVLSALDCVDYVVLFSDDTPLRLINEIKPDVLVKGGDYKLDEVVGYKEVEAYGGRVELVPIFQGFSTTQLIEKIINKYNNS